MSEYDLSLTEYGYTPEFTRPLNELIECASGIPRGEPWTYGATPLDQRSGLIKEQQKKLLTDLFHEYIYKVPTGVSLEIASYVSDTFSERFHSRMSANGENYETSLIKKGVYGDNYQVMEMLSRAEQGYASPAELLIVQKLLGIRSIELACLTHPYGERIEQLQDMRGAVAESICVLGGEHVENPTERYRIKDVILRDVPREEWATVYALSNKQRLHVAEQYGGVIGLLVTRKRDLGYMPDGTVVRERSSLVLRTDDNDIISEKEHHLLQNEDSSDWEDAALKTSGLDISIRELMQADQHTTAIPIASTIYAFNREIARKVYAKQDEQINGTITTPIDMEYAEAALQELRYAQNFGDMFYIGPEIND